MEILPESRLQAPKGVTRGQHVVGAYRQMLNWAPIFCANCGTPGGFVPEETCTFAFYLCQPCADSLPPIEGTYVEPDAVFWAKVVQAQEEAYGRILSPPEIVEALKDGQHFLSKLARERR